MEWGGEGRRGAEMVGVGRGRGGVGEVVGRSGAVGVWGRVEVGDRTQLVGVGWEQRRTQGGAWLRRERARLESGREVRSLVEDPRKEERRRVRRMWMVAGVGRSLPDGVGTGVAVVGSVVGSAVGNRLTVGAADGAPHMPTVAPAPPDLTSLPFESATDQLISPG